MIKNQKQAVVTRRKIKELKSNRDEFQKEWGDKTKNQEYDLAINSFNSLIEELSGEFDEYNSLLEGDFHCFQPSSLENIPEILIKARLAQKISQKELASLLGIKEQQVQRYEQTDFEGVTYNKLIEFSYALNIKFYLEKVLILRQNKEDLFEYPEGLNKEDIQIASEKIKEGAFLIMC